MIKMNKSKIPIRTSFLTAFMFLFCLSETVQGQISNSGFENQLTDWIHVGATIKSSSTFYNWTVNSADSKMAEIIPTSLDANTAASFLKLSPGSLTWPKVTNFGVLSQDIILTQGQVVTMSWNYLSEEYSPNDDGCFASLSCAEWQEVKVLVRTTTDGIIKATGKFGSSGWHSVSFMAPADGIYRLGFGVFNYLDKGYNPHLFIDNTDGSTFAPGFPVLTTLPITNPDESSIVTGGSVAKAGTGSVTSRGIVYGLSPNPVINEPGVVQVSGGSGLGSFTCPLTGLSQGETYYIRAFATNSSNLTSYGGTVKYTPIHHDTPTVVTQSIGSITNSTATVEGTIINDGGTPITAKGVIWNSTGNPTLSSYLGIADLGTGNAPFSASLAGLEANTAYYVKAFATNGTGTGYGSQITFTTATVAAPAPAISYRMSNPRIHDANSFEFDIEVKSSEEVFLKKGVISFNFNDQTFDSDDLQWVNTKGPIIEGNTPDADVAKYKWTYPTPMINGNNAVAGFESNVPNASAGDTYFNKVTTEWQLIMTIRAPLISGREINFEWDESGMAGQQYYQIETSAIPFGNLILEDISFHDIFLERLYTSSHGWQEQGSGNAPDFSVPKMTSILNGNVMAGPDWNFSTLRVHPDATLTLSPYSNLQISGELDLQAWEGILIESDASRTGSLIASKVTGTGSARIQRHVTGNSWHLLSSPVSGQTIANFLSSNTLIPLKEGVRGFTTYNTGVNGWNPMFTSSSDGSLTTGTGYLARTSSDGEIEFLGQIAAGDLTLPVSAIGSGWNLVGNPYTSSIHVNDPGHSFLDHNKHLMDPAYLALYVWDESYSTSSYKVINYLTDPVMASIGQGFLIKLMETGTVGFNTAMQVHPTESRQKSAAKEHPRATLSLNQADKQASTDIIFSSQATVGLDPGYDAGLLNLDADFSIFTRLVEDNGLDYMIQAIPLPHAQPYVIPLGLTCETNKTSILSAKLTNMPSNVKVELHDRQNNKFYPITGTQADVSILLTDSTTLKERFVVVISGQTTPVTNEIMEPDFRIYQNQGDLILHGQVSSDAILRVSDIQGRIISEFKPGQGIYHRIPLTDLKTGIYLVQVSDKNRFKSFKVPVTSR